MHIHINLTQDDRNGVLASAYATDVDEDVLQPDEGRFLRVILRLLRRYSPLFDHEYETATDGDILVCRFTPPDFREFDERCARILRNTYGFTLVHHRRASYPRPSGRPGWVSVHEFSVDPDWFNKLSHYALNHQLLDSAMLIAGCVGPIGDVLS